MFSDTETKAERQARQLAERRARAAVKAERRAEIDAKKTPAERAADAAVKAKRRAEARERAWAKARLTYLTSPNQNRYEACLTLNVGMTTYEDLVWSGAFEVNRPTRDGRKVMVLRENLLAYLRSLEHKDNEPEPTETKAVRGQWLSGINLKCPHCDPASRQSVRDTNAGGHECQAS